MPTIRPEKLEEFVGQENVKAMLSVSIEAAKRSGKPHPHTLLFGPPGLGKTTLAKIIASELGVNFHQINAASMVSFTELEQVLADLTPGGNDVLFVDEIHALPRRLEEALYPVLEEFIYYRVNTRRPSNEKHRDAYWVDPFTLIAATTNPGNISKPLRDRFGLQLYLTHYKPDELAIIALQHAVMLGFDMENEAALMVGQRARGTARVAASLTDRLVEYVTVRNRKRIYPEDVEAVCRLLDIDAEGKTALDRKYLAILANANRPLGIKAIAAMMGEDVDTIENVIEPFLLDREWIVRTDRGRALSALAIQALQSEVSLSVTETARSGTGD